MAESHSHEEHHSNLFRAYMLVAIVLGVATATSFFFNWLARPVEDGGAAAISRIIAFVLILSVAIIKATLVGLYFMHLKWDWRLLYFLIVPAFILGTMMMFVLLPDTVFSWHNDFSIEPPPAPR